MIYDLLGYGNRLKTNIRLVKPTVRTYYKIHNVTKIKPGLKS